MRAVILGLKADADDPLANKAGVLPRTHVPQAGKGLELTVMSPTSDVELQSSVVH